ncbi:MAG: AraC family transcriptional regulator [Oscillospiraceae bacterium]
MIEELTILSFSKFGDVGDFSPKKLPAQYTRMSMVSLPRTEESLRVFDTDIYIKPINGLGVIFIGTELRSCRCFLLDKQILLNKGVTFCICAYEQTFNYELYHKSDANIFNDQPTQHINAYKPALETNMLLTAFYQDKGLDFSTINQQREFWQFIYMDKGNMRCTVDSQNLDLNQGEYLFILPNQTYSQSALESRSFSFFSVIFDINFEHSEVFEGKVLKTSTTINRIVREMISEFRCEDQLKYDILCSYIPILLNTSYREIVSVSSIKHAATSVTQKSINVMVENCLRIIGDNLNGDLTVPTIAKYLHISPSYLSKIFKDEVGVNLSEYVRDYRLEASKELIRQGNYSLSQIADMIGFCSIHYFSAQFKVKYGIPPREYSKALIQD